MPPSAPQRPDPDARPTPEDPSSLPSALTRHMRLLPPAVAPPIPYATENPAPPVACSCPRGIETVLVIEDDELVRRLLGRTLVHLGYQVHLAATGTEALAVHQAHGPGIDAVLCDVVMPDISGPEAVRRMLAGARRQPAVIFMSGHTDHALLSDGRLQCARYFLQKPLVRATIARTLRDALDALALDALTERHA